MEGFTSSHHGVGCINVHMSHPILDFKSFEIQVIRHVGTVGHTHVVRVGVLVSKVVDMLTRNLNDTNVIDVEGCSFSSGCNPQHSNDGF